MGSLAVLRLYLKMQSMPRLPIPHIGNAGILYTTPLIDRNRQVMKEEAVSTTDCPANGTALNRIVSNMAMGSYFFRRFSTTTDDIKKAEIERQKKNKKKLQTEETIKIMLVLETGALSVVTLNDANKIANKKRLQLVHITNEKDKPVRTEKEVYKLVSKLDLLDDEDSSFKPPKDRKEKDKEEKTILLKSNIGDNDVASKIKNIQKWVSKGHRVRVMISQVGDKGDAEDVFSKIESKVGEVEGRIQQKIMKGNELRFYIGPPKAKKQKSSTDKKKSSEPKAEDEYSDSEDESENDEIRVRKK